MSLWKWLALAVWITVPSASASTLDEQLANLAAEVQSVLKAEGADSVELRIDDISTADLKVDVPNLVSGLSAALSARGIGLSDEARHVLRGEYALFVDDESRPPLMKAIVSLRVLKRSGKSLLKTDTELTATIANNTDLARTTGPTVVLPPLMNRSDRNARIREAHADPRKYPAVVDGTRVRAAADSGYALEVLVRENPTAEAVPAGPTLEAGRAYVSVPKDAIYEVWVHNLTDREAAVTLSVDGIDVFHFSEERDEETGRPKFSHYIVAPRSPMAVTGWHQTNDQSRDDNVLKFLVVAHGQGAASRLNVVGGVGVITATFAASYTDEEELRKAEGAGARGVGDLETGFGPREKVDFEPVARKIGVVREVVSVRYVR